MRKLCVMLATLLFAPAVLAEDVEMEQDGILRANGPSLPVGGRNSANDLTGMFEFESTTGVNSQWVTTSAGSAMTICDAAGECIDVEQYGATFLTTIWGLHVKSGMYFYDITNGNFSRWSGDALQDNVDNASIMPYVNSYLMGFDGGTDWYRLRMLQAGDALAADTWGLVTTGQTHFYDGTNFRRWLGGQLNADNLAATTYAPYNASFNYAYDGATWDRLTITASGDALAAALPGLTVASMTHFYDGTNFRRWIGGQLNADNVAAPYAPYAGVMLYGHDGTNWDRLQVDTVTAGLRVHRTWTLAGESVSNDHIKVKKDDVSSTHPDSQTETTGAAPVTALDSREVLSDPNWCVYVKNTGANPFTDVDVESSPNSSDWVDLGWAACDALGAGSACQYCVSGSAHRYIRVRITSGGGASSSAVWYTANKG